MALSCLVLSAACADDSGRAGASFSLVVDSPARPVGSVGYEIVCEEGDPLHDQLESLDDVLSSLWGAYVELPAGHCEVALTAFDATGVALCTGQLDFEVAVGEVAEPSVVMDCDEQQSGGDTTVIIQEININICTVLVVGVRNIAVGTGSLEDNSEGDLTLEVSTIGQCSDAGLSQDIIAEAIANDPTVLDASGGKTCETLTCDDGNDCTDDGCLQGVCAIMKKADETPCNDGLGSCTQGVCVQPAVEAEAAVEPEPSADAPPPTSENLPDTEQTPEEPSVTP
jgi:hypothetical protein